ncbi:hypothetical protein GCM10009760_32610 [Kitasatospora kazusensis]|uniref:Uncharacterized protein n=1 Tax=Kitasatospora kazusensis TaxID=407974 RepID=A0ABN2ZMY4_9ACTN
MNSVSALLTWPAYARPVCGGRCDLCGTAPGREDPARTLILLCTPPGFSRASGPRTGRAGRASVRLPAELQLSYSVT